MSEPIRIRWLTDVELRVARYRLRLAAEAARSAVKRRGTRINPKVASMKARSAAPPKDTTP